MATIGITILILLVLTFIQLALGATVTKAEFRHAFRKPLSLFLATFLQFIIMPPYLYAVIHIFNVTPQVALGMMMIAVSPGGTSSNLFTYFAYGDVALSITATTLATLAALGLMPLLLFIYVDNGNISNDSLKVDYVGIVITGFVLIIPAIIGAYVRYKSAFWAKRLEKVGGALGAIFLLAAAAYAIVQESSLFKSSAGLWFGAWSLQWWGTAIGYVVAMMFKLSRPDQRTIAINTGVQNVTLALGAIAASNFSDEDERAVSAYPLIEGFCWIFNSIAITLFFRKYVAKHDVAADRKDSIIAEEDKNEDPFNPMSPVSMSTSTESQPSASENRPLDPTHQVNENPTENI